MSGRPDLRLTDDERARFLGEALATEPAAWASRGADGYPDIGLVHARLDADSGSLVLGDPAGASDAPADGAPVCVIVEQGATYDDICAVVARGTVHAGRLALDDLVTFAFAKAARGS
jgi:hypothetical protein